MKVKIQIFLIIVLMFFNFVLILRHIKVLKLVSAFDMNEVKMVLEENSINGKILPRDILNMFKSDKDDYFLILIFRSGDCSVCLNFIVPLLSSWADSLNVNVFGLYADSDSIQMKRHMWLYKIRFKVFSEPSIVNVLSLKRTPYVLFITGRGAVVYSYYPDYLKPDRSKDFFFKVGAILRGNN